MTSDALVKEFLTADACFLYDRNRIKNLFKNVALKQGKLVNVDDKFISIIHSIGKSKKLTYFIPKELLTDKQLSLI
jgi:hypothetical protein